MYEHIQKQGSALCKLKKQCKAKKLKDVCDLDRDPVMQKLASSLSVEPARLLAGVIRNSRQKPKGRRWNFEDEVLALALLKRSPKSYILLQTLFPLPSRRTLQSVLNTVHFTAGINAHVFGALKHSAQTMSDKDRYCILMFDEMSIRENLCFKQKLGCIEGFEDFGSQGRTSNIANHALVFMVSGLHQKWKQPVAYYFSRRSTKAEMLTQILKEVLDACQNAGLQVVATVCDMGANNIKALKLLGATQSKPFFKFQDQDIVTVYDPPHLLKCTRNLFLKYDVQFESELMGNQLPVVAKWEHILNVRKWDKGNIVHLLYKLTDAHLCPTAQCTMKVSLAAQVMSHTVAASLNATASKGKEHCSAFFVL
jgi:hypothetical protein